MESIGLPSSVQMAFNIGRYSNELVKVVRILSNWTNGSRPDESDVGILRRSGRPGESDLPIEELASLIVRRVCEKELHECRKVRKAPKRLA
jgi:hypothetical protein